MALSVFRIYQPDAFTRYLRQTVFQRKISFVQNHHTWRPGYADFARHGDHMACLESMRRAHIRDRKWSDIGQNITIFPDGKIGLCRPIDLKPAGIYGANTGAICIESLGNFDIGGDIMTEAQRNAILDVNAALCLKFGLKPVPHQVVYHHWYDTAGRRFGDADINSGAVQRRGLQKSCPGTAFFAPPGVQGNTITSAVAHFFPLVAERMRAMNGERLPQPEAELHVVKAESLNVRAGRGVQFPVVRRLPRNMQVPVYETLVNDVPPHDKWSRISSSNEEWVSTAFLQ